MSETRDVSESVSVECERFVELQVNDSFAKLASRAQLSTRKRRRDQSVENRLLSKPFEIRPWPCSHLDKPITAYAELLLPRARLPLAFLDQGRRSSVLPKTRLFLAHVDLLEKENESNILIVRVAQEPSLYAVERVQDGIYSICKLGAWVALDEFRAALGHAAAGYCSEPAISPADKDNGAWWKTALLKASKDEAGRKKRKSEHEFQKPPLAQSPPWDHSVQLVTNEVDASVGGAAEDLSIADHLSSLACATGEVSELQDVITTIVTQYLETLYLSKTSLAYFAKGPLKKALVMVGSLKNPVKGLQGLAVFLRSMIIPMAAMDKKYKQSIFTLLSQPASPMNGSSSTLSKQHTKKRKKIRLGKDGLYPSEGTFLEKWWSEVDLSDNIDFVKKDKESSLKNKLSELRIRESLMQLILILEVLAIEAPLCKQAQGANHAVLVETEAATENGGDTTRSKKRPKSSIALESSLDMLVERLCIWQSVHANNEITSNGNLEVRLVTLLESHGVPQLNNDFLKDFCREVVLPFYGGRLPDVVRTLSQKLGASTGFTSKVCTKFSMAPHKAQSSPKSLQRDTPQRRKCLQRVMTDTAKNVPKAPPALARSSTDTLLLPGMRSGSGQLPSTDCFKEGRKPFSRSSSISQTRKLLNQREVDICAISNGTTKTPGRSVQIAQELKNAIATLKKPNRAAAVKDYVDAADQRVGGRGRSCIDSVTPRKLAFGIQVKATPKRLKKTKDAVDATPPQKVLQAFPATELPIPSSDYCVPSSALQAHGTAGLSSIKRLSNSPELENQALPGVDETPSRENNKNNLHLPTQSGIRTIGTSPSRSGSASTMGRLPCNMANVSQVERHHPNVSTVISSTSIQSQGPLVLQRKDFNAASKLARLIDIPGTSFCDEQTAPIPPRDPIQRVPSSSTINTSTNAKAPVASKSIYHSLGWDDGEIDELL